MSWPKKSLFRKVLQEAKAYGTKNFPKYFPSGKQMHPSQIVSAIEAQKDAKRAWALIKKNITDARTPNQLSADIRNMTIDDIGNYAAKQDATRVVTEVQSDVGNDLTHIADRIDKLNKYITDNSGKITQRRHITEEGNLEKINPKTTKEMENTLQELKNINKEMEDFTFLQNMYGRNRPVDQSTDGFENDDIGDIDPETLKGFLDFKHGGPVKNVGWNEAKGMGGMTSAFRHDWGPKK